MFILPYLHDLGLENEVRDRHSMVMHGAETVLDYTYYTRLRSYNPFKVL
jgi:hypothetical protein